MTRSDLRWHTIILIAICWADDPLQSWAQSSPQRPRCSVTTEQDLQDEMRYLQEETISVVDHTDQLLVQAVSSKGLLTEDNTLDSSMTDLLMRLRQGNSVGMMPLNVRGFTISRQGNR